MCDARRFYCNQCGQEHAGKMRDRKAHELVPATDDGNKCFQDCEAYFEGVNAGISSAERDLIDRSSRLIEEIQARQMEGLRKLQEIKEAAASDCAIVKTQLRGGPSCPGRTLPFVNLLKSRPTDTIPSSFRYEATLPSPSSINISITYYPLNTYHENMQERRDLPIIKDDPVLLSLDNGHVDPTSIPTLRSNHRYWAMAYCFQDADTLFCVGGERGAAFSLNLNRKSSREGRDYGANSLLHRQLSCPGVCMAEQLLYVFGGAIEDGRIRSTLKSAQLLVPASGRWTALPEMPNPRSNFNPVPYLRCIYLPGGYHSQSLFHLNSPLKIDKYGMDSQSYVELFFAEPIKPECSAASFAVGRKIVIISSKSIYTLENDSLKLTSDLPKEQRDLAWAQLAVSHGLNIYYYSQKSSGRAVEVFKLDMQTLTLASFPINR